MLSAHKTMYVRTMPFLKVMRFYQIEIEMSAPHCNTKKTYKMILSGKKRWRSKDTVLQYTGIFNELSRLLTQGWELMAMVQRTTIGNERMHMITHYHQEYQLCDAKHQRIMRNVTQKSTRKVTPNTNVTIAMWRYQGHNK